MATGFPLLVTLFFLASVSAGLSGSCYEIGGMVRCSDDVGRESTLQSIDKAMGGSGSYSPPPSYPDALKSYPSEIKSFDGREKEKRSDIYTDDRDPKTTLETPGLTKGKR